MKTLLIFLVSCVGMVAASMPEFPVNRVNNYPGLKAWFKEAAHTVAAFEMERTMPSGRVLKSRGTFEFRRGEGMMWRTEHPVRNAMVITPETLLVYDARGRELRRNSLKGAAAARYTGLFMNEMKPEDMKQLEHAFTITSRADTQAACLVVGMKARHASNDLRWLLFVVRRGMLEHVYYESARQGMTHVIFSKVRLSEKLPTEPFAVTK